MRSVQVTCLAALLLAAVQGRSVQRHREASLAPHAASEESRAAEITTTPYALPSEPAPVDQSEPSEPAGLPSGASASSATGATDAGLTRRLSEVFPELRANATLVNNTHCASGHCILPSSETWLLDANLTVETLTIWGTLVWDTDSDGLELGAGYVLVEQGGHLRIGTTEEPMLKRATLNLTAGGRAHFKLGQRFLGSLGAARIEIHGRPLQRTWTLLSRTARPGGYQLFLKHDPIWMGWRPGDRIGIATTSRAESVVHRISRISGATEWPLRFAGAVAGVERADWNEPASAAIDGIENTRWGSWCTDGCDGGEQWIRLRLQNASQVTRLEINFDPLRYAPKYELFCVRGNASTSAANVTNHTGGWREVRFPAEKACDEVRLVADYAAMDRRGPRQTEPAWSGLWLYEVRAYGRAVGEEIPMVVYLEEPLKDKHLGGLREVEGRPFELAAEVVNLERNVLITGDRADFDATHRGIHTIMAASGVMDIRYARVEHCGQRDSMGRYCMHLHRAGSCPECVFKGNAVVDSHQIGITLHGVHNATVQENTLWDVRAVGIYTEDGNEMHNQILRNVVVCTTPAVCNVPYLGWEGQSAGIYLVGMMNDLVENRVAGYLHGMWFAGSVHPQGQGMALSRVCPRHTPFGVVRGNVNHDNSNFGLYTDNQFPRNLDLDESGFVRNMGSCGEFKPDGTDNGVVPANKIEDELDYHNIFVGQYSMGDTSYVRFTSVNNAHGMYWKASKNFADGVSHHIVDSVFANDHTDPYGQLQLFGPSGPFTFLLTNTSFLGGPVGNCAVCAGQHCGRVGAGGPCDVQYVLSGVDFSRLQAGARRIKFGMNALDFGFVQPIFTSTDRSLGGRRSIVSPHLDGFASVPGCEPLGREWDFGHGCDVHVRRLNVWSPSDMGNLTLSGPGYDVPPRWESPTNGFNGGILEYEPMHRGYGAPVVVGANYTLNGTWRGSLAIEFSDKRISQAFGAAEALKLTIVGAEAHENECELFATDSRAFLGAFGPQSGVVVPAMSKCEIFKAASYDYDASAETTSTTAPPQPSACRAEDDVPCCPDGSCPETCSGSVQCCPGGVTCPSASIVESPVCKFGKRFDCTDMTGVAPPGRKYGACAFPNEPMIQYYWEPWCTGGTLGCLADGVNVECRFCGAGPWVNVTCPPPPPPPPTSTTATSTTGAGGPATTTAAASTTPFETCDALPEAYVRQSCTADGCTVLAERLMMESANGTHAHNCTALCATGSLECLGAWEELGGGCEAGGELSCDSPRPEVSALICECRPVPTTTTTTTTANPLGSTIRNTGPNGICLQVPAVGLADLEVQMWTCDGEPGQRWAHDPATGQVRNVDGLCLDAPVVDKAGGLLRMRACDAGSWHQQWVYDETAGQIRNAGPHGICVDASQRSALGGKVHMWHCDPLNPNQWWALQRVNATEVSHPELHALKAEDGHCLAAPGGAELGREVAMRACNRSESGELWFYDDFSGLVRNLLGLCLDSPQREKSSGRVHVWSCDTANRNQQWDYNATTGALKNRHGVCLDASERKTDGGKAHMWECIPGHWNQRWLFIAQDEMPLPAEHGATEGAAVVAEAVAVVTAAHAMSEVASATRAASDGPAPRAQAAPSQRLGFLGTALVQASALLERARASVEL